MNILLISFILILFLTSAMFSVLFFGERRKNLTLQGKYSPFEGKNNFLNGAEIKLLRMLESFLSPDKYRIYPQQHLSTLIRVKDDANDMKGKWEWINELFADYVIFDAKDLKPLLVIELNGPTHKWGSRIARDQFVKKALGDVGIPILEIDIKTLPNSDKVKNLVIEKLKN